MTTTLKMELLNDALDVNGIGLNLPENAIGVVGPEVDSEFKVMRGGQEMSVKPGSILLKGDIIRTGSTSQIIYLSASQAVAMTKIALAPNQEMTMNPDTVLGLDGEAVEVAATEALNPELLATTDNVELSGLFGALGILGGAGLPIAAGAVALAAVGGSSGSSSASEDAGNGGGTGGGGTGGGDNGTGGGGAGGGETAGGAGPFSSGAAQLDAALGATPLGSALPFSFADGAAQLEAALPVGGGAGGGSDTGGGPFSSGAAQLDAALSATPLGGVLPFNFADGAAQLEGALPIPTASDSGLGELPVNIGLASGLAQLGSAISSLSLPFEVPTATGLPVPAAL